MAEMAGVGITNADARAVEYGGKQPVGASVEVIAGKDFVAGGEQPGYSADGGQPAREAISTRRIFQLRQQCFECGARWIAAARVVVTAKLLRALLLERGRLVNRRGYGLERIAGTGIEVDETAGNFHKDLPAAMQTSATFDFSARQTSNTSPITDSVAGQRPAPLPRT